MTEVAGITGGAVTITMGVTTVPIHSIMETGVIDNMRVTDIGMIEMGPGEGATTMMEGEDTGTDRDDNGGGYRDRQRL